ncbi:MAG: peptidase domain-containing ABC transporter [Acidobacteriota bacterium]|nr:peptidase domain-containing ABC transporter [Acidobacteriota bacterium]
MSTPPFQTSGEDAERAELRRPAALEDDLKFLQTVRVFAPLQPHDLERILDQSVRRAVPRGEYLFREDEASGACFIIRTGRVQLLKKADQSRKQLAVRRSGDLVGEIELLYGTPRMADAVAATDVDLFELPQAAFDALIPDGRCREAIFSSATNRLLQYQNALADSDRRAMQEQLPALTPRWITMRQGLFSHAYPFVAVETRMAAGVACLAMLDRFHGRDSAWEAHLEQLLAEGTGDTLVSLSRKADEFGYLTRLVQVDIHSAAGLPLPAIIEDEHQAPAVLFSLGRRGAIIASPEGELRLVTRTQLEATWRGQVLTVAHVPERPFRHLLHANRRLAGAVAASSLLIAVLALAGPLAAKLVVDRVVVNADTALLRLLAAGLLVTLAFRIAAGALREQLLVHATRRAVLFLQVHLLDHVLRLPLGAAQKVGDAARFRHTEHLVESAVAAGLPLAVDTMAVAIGLAVVFALSPPLALVAALFVVSYGLMGLALRPSRRARPAELRPSAREYLVELVAGIQTVKALASETQCTARGTRLMLQARGRALDAARTLRTRQVTGTVLHLAAGAAVLGYGASLTLAGRASAGDVIASLAIVSGMIVPVEALLDAGSAARQLRETVTSMQQVLDLPPEESAGRGVAAPVTGHIRLTEVSFRYPGTTEDAVSDLNLEILPGQKVALVGRSGSGKTTLVNLLTGLYQPTRGTIHLDGTDLIAIPKPALRRQLGIVEQHPFLFAGTIADNISRGDPSVTEAQVVRAAELAGAAHFIAALPQGYQTPVGARGARLSGGERQRLTIARALVSEPRLVVLDEATSALDSETEHAIYGSLERALGGRTVIVIAHRLSTVRHADVIVVLDRGRIVEVGSDRELMSRRGLYYYLATRTV